MTGLGYLGVLESLSKLETRYVKKLFGKSLKHTEIKNCVDKN